jgi:hypothetical protein
MGAKCPGYSLASTTSSTSGTDPQFGEIVSTLAQNGFWIETLEETPGWEFPRAFWDCSHWYPGLINQDLM